MGYQWVKVRAFVDEGERPDHGLPGQPPYPDNSLPGGGHYPDQGLPPFIWTGPIYPPVYPDNSLPTNPRPDQGLPPYPDQGLPGQPPRPDQGLPPYPDQGLPGGGNYPDQGLPTPPIPEAYDIEDEPTDPPEGGAGQYVVVVLNGEAKWAWIESEGDVEIEPPEVEA